MHAVRVSGGESGEATYDEAVYELRGMTEDDARKLAALADFPLWHEQPKDVGEFCAALHDKLHDVVPNAGKGMYASDVGMTGATTADL